MDTSPHPEGSFSFNTGNAAFIKSTSDIEPAKPQTPPLPPTKVKGNPSEYPVAGFKFGGTTKTVIQAAEGNTSVRVPAPEIQQQQQQQQPEQSPSIRAPEVSNVNVVAGGQALNTAPGGNAVSSPYQQLPPAVAAALSRGGYSYAEQQQQQLSPPPAAEPTFYPPPPSSPPSEPTAVAVEAAPPAVVRSTPKSYLDTL